MTYLVSRKLYKLAFDGIKAGGRYFVQIQSLGPCVALIYNVERRRICPRFHKRRWEVLREKIKRRSSHIGIPYLELSQTAPEALKKNDDLSANLDYSTQRTEQHTLPGQEIHTKIHN